MEEDIIEIWCHDKDNQTIIKEVIDAVESGKLVELIFGTKFPEIEVLKEIAHLWKKRKVTISVYNDHEFKFALKKLKEYS